MNPRKHLCRALALSTLTFAMGAALAKTGEHPGTPTEDLKYQGAPIAMDPSQIVHNRGMPACQSTKKTISPNTKQVIHKYKMIGRYRVTSNDTMTASTPSIA